MKPSTSFRKLFKTDKSDEKYLTLLDLIATKKVIARSEYEGVKFANHYPLGTYEFFNGRGLKIKKGEKSQIKSELGQALFTSSQIYEPMGRSVAAEINSPHSDWWGDCY